MVQKSSEGTESNAPSVAELNAKITSLERIQALLESKSALQEENHKQLEAKHQALAEEKNQASRWLTEREKELFDRRAEIETLKATHEANLGLKKEEID